MSYLITPSHAATVDYMVLYDGYTASHFNNQPETAIRNWIKSINSYYTNSQVDIQLRLVGVFKHEETGSTMSAVLSNLRKNDWVKRKRDEVGADFVTQLHKTGSCGIGYVSLHSEWAYNVVGPKCGPLTAAHELGHNMGLLHSRRQGDTKGAKYKYGLGHGVDGVYGTIMTYNWLFKAPKVPNFSNPRVKCKGISCGVDESKGNSADAAKAMHLERNHFAKFRPTKVQGGNSGGSDGGTNQGGEGGTNGGNNGGDNTNLLANGVYLMQAKHSAKCVDVYGAGRQNGANIIQWSCHRGNNQRWVFKHLSDKIYEIRAKHSNKCMDVAGYKRNNGGNIHQWHCHGGKNQQWRVIKNKNGTYSMRSVHSGKFVDVSGVSRSNGASIHQWRGHDGANQQFYLRRTN